MARQGLGPLAAHNASAPRLESSQTASGPSPNDGKIVPMIRVAMVFLSRESLGLGRKRRPAIHAGISQRRQCVGGPLSAAQYLLGLNVVDLVYVFTRSKCPRGQNVPIGENVPWVYPRSKLG